MERANDRELAKLCVLILDLTHRNVWTSLREPLVQRKMKDRDTFEQSFSVDDKVLILLPLSRYPFKARVHGLYEVAKKDSYLKTIL